jgi:tetraacyldisaccharide 4'-kinase
VGWAGRLEALLQRLWWRREPGWAAQALRPLSWLYRTVAALPRAAYAFGWRHPERAPVPVLVVGNLVAGGAGKTPTVIALVQALRLNGWTPGVISRGHGRRGTQALEVGEHSQAAEVGDEPLLIRRRSAAPVAVGRRRIEAARLLCAAHADIDVLVADDGLQHLRLHRDVQVIVFDERGVGNGLLLPAGPLRQPRPRHIPVNSHVLYNAARPSTPWPGALARRDLAGAVRLEDWWLGANATVQALAGLRGCKRLAAAGMAAPQRFFDMLRAHGLDIEPLPLPDHHGFDPLPWPADTADVLVTEKDAVKLPSGSTGTTRVWVVTLDFHLPEDFTAAVLRNLRLAHRP